MHDICDVMHSCIRLSCKCTELFDICVLRLFTWPLFQNESDCPSYPTERYTVDIRGVQVADLTADAVQSLAINHSNSSVTLSLPLLSQPLPENAVTLNMTKYDTVPTNRSDVKGSIVTDGDMGDISCILWAGIGFSTQERYYLSS